MKKRVIVGRAVAPSALAVLFALATVAGSFTGPAAAGGAPTSSVYDGIGTAADDPPSPIPCGGTEAVLLIQDNVPWFAPAGQDPLGADVTELKAQNRDFCIGTSQEVATGVVNLAQFTEILIAGAQTQLFYDTLFPGGVVLASLQTWVGNGGVLSANLADCASGPGAGGGWPCGANAATSFAFVGGVKHVASFPNDNSIAAPANPLVADALPCPGGHCAPQVDAGVLNDLDGWGSSAHGYFVNLPAGTTVVLTQPDVTGDGRPEPVAVEYPFGSGIVIANLTTTEWRYVGDFGGLPQNKKLLANEIAYQDFLAVIEVEVDVKPGSFPNSIKLSNKGVVPVAILSTTTFDATTVDPSTVCFGDAENASQRDCTEAHGKGHLANADGDGLLDLVLHYETGQTGVDSGDTRACLRGETFGGRAIEGCDSVRTLDP